LPVGFVGISGEEDYRRVVVELPQPPAQLTARPIRQPIVEQVYVEGRAVREFQSAAHTISGDNFVVVRAEQGSYHEANVIMVVGKEDAGLSVLHDGESRQS
jgi:hypothetical protein